MTIEVKQSDGRVVSFIEKQLAVTQKRHAEVETALADVMSAIEDNARLQLHLHELACDVMRCPTLEDAVALLKLALKERFSLKDVVLWGQEGSELAPSVPSPSMQDFMTHLVRVRLENGEGERFPLESWSVPGVVSGCAFRLVGKGYPFGVLLLGRQDDGFVGEIDTLFLQQFVEIMGFWLEAMGAAGSLSGGYVPTEATAQAE
jgi:uncharacterized protein YigA (DUF484 family)